MTETEIANLALGHLGAGVEISNLDSERSAEAGACRRFYTLAVQNTLRDFAWPFATRIEALDLVEEDPNDEWAYSYRLPAAWMRVNRIPSGVRNDNRQSRVPYRISSDDQGKLIFTDKEDAEAEYVATVDSSYFPPDFTLTVSYQLAYLIAPWLTKGDPFKLGQLAYQNYQMQIMKAQAAAGNEEQPEEHPESEFIRARE